jgi:hypothetical protein
MAPGGLSAPGSTSKKGTAMGSGRQITGTESRACPPYRGVVVVDTESFSTVPSALMPDLSADVPGVLQTAFHRCGLGAIWDQRRFPDGTGDGVVFGVWPEDLPFVIHPLLDTLQEVLEEHDRVLRSRSRELRLRLRMSIHVGPIPDIGVPERDRISTPTIGAFRIADAKAVKERLKAADPDVTMLVALLSQRVYEDMVLGGYAGIHPNRFTKLDVEVADKGFAQPGWMYIPRPSHGVAGARRSETAERRDGSDARDRSGGEAVPGVAPVFHGHVENATTLGQNFGGLTITGRGSVPEMRDRGE